MPSNKTEQNQQLRRRTPRQTRSREKLELILEAATRLIDAQGLAALSTNKIAERAGVSIGTLYQYFPDKAAIVSELGRRELERVQNTIIATLSAPADQATPTGERAQMVIRAVFSAYGGRSRVRRELLELALAEGRTSLVEQAPLQVGNLLAGEGFATAQGSRRQLSSAEAFVLTQAFVGVSRAWVRQLSTDLSQADVEAALLRLVSGFMREPPP